MPYYHIFTLFNSSCGEVKPPPAFPFFNFDPMKYTQTTLDKLEAIPEQSGYILRYERGTFQSGYCILESKKVVVLNKFLQIEGRINTLMDLIPHLEIDIDQLTDDSQRLYINILSKLENAENAENPGGTENSDTPAS